MDGWREEGMRERERGGGGSECREGGEGRGEKKTSLHEKQASNMHMHRHLLADNDATSFHCSIPR